MKYLSKILLLATCIFLLSGTAYACDDDCDDNCCPRSPGYWKNHDWPETIGDSIEIGGITYYRNKEYGTPTFGDARERMSQPVSGDKTYTMFKALVAAKLNNKNGCDTICAIGCADTWMLNYLKYDGEKFVECEVLANSYAWECGETLYNCLDKYNNGECCCDCCSD